MSATKAWEKIEQAHRADVKNPRRIVAALTEYEGLMLEWARRVIEREEALAQQGKK